MAGSLLQSGSHSNSLSSSACRSLGTVMYVLLSGVSPFLDESQEETCSNIVRNDFCFPDEYFAGISSDAKDLVRSMLVEDLQ